MMMSADCPGQVPARESVEVCPGQSGTGTHSGEETRGQPLSTLSGTGPDHSAPRSLAGPVRLAASLRGGQVPDLSEVVACRAATVDEIPRTALQIIAKAEAAGWSVAATYARCGAESLALRMCRDDQRARATWVDRRFSAAWTWSKTQPIRLMGARDFAREVTRDAL